MDNTLKQLRSRFDEASIARLSAIRCTGVHRFVAESVQLCDPERVLIVTDTKADLELIRKRAVDTGEERKLKLKGHTIHFDSYFDLARDTGNTRYLVPEDEHLDATLVQTARQSGLSEIRHLLRNSMHGKDMLVRFYSLAPVGSPFSILAMQITDSYYVAHSLDLLYRSGYKGFVSLERSGKFFKILHSAGLLQNGVSTNVGTRRIFIDLKEDTVYSVNTQYAGNTVGLKKLAFRLAIRKADREGWLAEHMFIMGVNGRDGRKTYFAGAFPSACGKTSTSMVKGETIVGDDLAYLREFDGEMRAANVEQGIFGIIQGVNAADDPVIFDSLTSPGEVIFSNVLIHDGIPYWGGDGREHPETGENYVGKWKAGVLGPDGREVPASNKNARYTLKLSSLRNLDPEADNPRGVPISGIIYGGRNSDTSVALREAFDWVHGVTTMGASLESESTAATIGKEGVLTFQPFSNIDFISIPLGQYIRNHLRFAETLKRPPRIFAVNYFLMNQSGQYLSAKEDKRVWLKWMEQRVHEEVDAMDTPVGRLPMFDDLRHLFSRVLDKDYTKEDYVSQFTLRIAKLLERNGRIEAAYRRSEEVPDVLYGQLMSERERLLEAKAKNGDSVSPERFA